MNHEVVRMTVREFEPAADLRAIAPTVATDVFIRLRREPGHIFTIVGGGRLANGSARDGDRRAANCLRAPGHPSVMSKSRDLSSAGK